MTVMECKAPANKGEIDALLEQGFDFSIAPKLEAYVQTQAKNGTYDFKANRHLLQLYNLSPSGPKMTENKVEAVEKIMLLALTQAPQPHFLACSYLIHGKMGSQDTIRTLTELHTAILSGDFPKLWAQLEEPRTKALVDKVPNFHSSMRRFVASTIADAYQSIALGELKKCFNLSDDAATVAFLKEIGWNTQNLGGGAQGPQAAQPTAAASGGKKGSKKKKKKSKKKSNKKGGNANAASAGKASSSSVVVPPLGSGNQFVPARTTESLSLADVSLILSTLPSS